MAFKVLSSVALLAGLTAADQFPDCVNGPLADNTVCDTSASVIDRARALVSVLTVPEKINLTGSNSPGVPRLGLYSYTWWNEALHGIATNNPGVQFSEEPGTPYSNATSFPMPILLGAAFDDELIHNVADAVSTEARAFNNGNRSGLDYWTPNINPYKDPRWGRGQETPGEDTFHIMSYINSLIPGLQGGHSPTIKKVIATCKHFVGYDLESYLGIDRNHFDAQISTQDLAEYYMPAFQACARDANVGSIMCSYNAINGYPGCADEYTMQTVLREHWNWTNDYQYITSDCDAVQNVYLPHAFADTPQAAAADAMISGVDVNCGDYYQIHLPDAYAQGLLNDSVLDQAVTRLYAGLVQVGYFDPPEATPYRSYNLNNVSTPEHQDLARHAAEEGIVLLKNDGTLPMQGLPTSNDTDTPLKIGIFGEYASASTQLLGNYYGIPPFIISPIDAAQALPGVQVLNNSAPGGQGNPTTDAWLEAIATANQSDVIIIAEGLDENVESEGMDRYRLDWTGAQIDLINQYASLGKPTILVQMGGGQLDDTIFLNNPNINAIVWAGLPGQAGGTAILNVLTGKTAPAGRLPVTQYPQNYVQSVNMTDMSLRPNDTTGNLGRTYRWYNDAVLPFGYGLQYTNFTVSCESDTLDQSSHDIASLTNDCNEMYQDRCAFASVPVTVQNTGNVASDYSALMFLSGDFGPQPQPYKTLVAYARAFGVQPGQSQTLTLNMTLASLARRDEMGNNVLYPGSYNVGVDVNADGSVKFPLGGFSLTGGDMTIEEWPQPY
ncbi:MAG: hypothetical protein Q9159_001348 [Coniocarpon cinnabarinum]